MNKASKTVPMCDDGSTNDQISYFPCLFDAAADQESGRELDVSCAKLWSDAALNRILSKVEFMAANSFSQVECLEMLIYLSSGCLDARLLAEHAMRVYGSLANVMIRPARELNQRIGLGHEVICLFSALLSCLDHMRAGKTASRKDLSSYAKLIDHLTQDIRDYKQEALRIIYLDAKYMIIKDQACPGSHADMMPFSPKEVAQRAAAQCASAVVLTRHYQSEDPTPSQYDINAAIGTKCTLESLDIGLLDYVIFARGGHFSMRRQHILDPIRQDTMARTQLHGF